VLALGGDVASKVAAALVVVIAARTFPVDEFAAVVTALAVAGVLAAALDLGAGTLLARDGASGGPARGALLRGLLEGRAPLVLVLLVAAIVVGVWLGDAVIALAVVGLAVAGALALSILGAYRSTRDLGPEARQRLAASTLAVGCALVCGLSVPRADVLLLALVLGTLVTLVPLALRLPAIADLSGSVSRVSVMRRVVPLGLLALATITYYRSGTIVLALLGDARETAAFGLAATLAFGLLMVPNAITTALLPRLAAEQSSGELLACARRALVWTLAIAVPLALAAAALASPLIPLLLGDEYTASVPAFIVLCAGVPIIATSGVVGTTLLAIGRLRVLGLQVGCSLLLNLTALALLAPWLGSVGAALATLVCEVGGLLLLLVLTRGLLPGLLSIRGVSFGDRAALPTPAGRERALEA
jgi:O-antigen/teichoic acid export membrane protein